MQNDKTEREAQDPLAPGLDEIERLALAAVAALDAPFRAHAGKVGLIVVDFAPQEMLDDLGIADPFELTGLYDGIPLPEKSVSDPGGHADVIWLFRRAILDEWIGRGDVGLGQLVGHVMVHELAHHFGWSDDDIAAIDQWWE